MGKGPIKELIGVNGETGGTVKNLNAFRVEYSFFRQKQIHKFGWSTTDIRLYYIILTQMENWDIF